MSVKQRQSVNEIVFGYWQGYTRNGNAPRSLQDTPEGVDVVSLAFGVIDAIDPNTIDTAFLTSQWSEKEIREGIDFLKTRGTKVILSLNGQPKLENGGWPQLDPVQFAANTGAFLANWNLDGLDLDNEDSYVPGNAFAEVIATLRQSLTPDALITLPVYLGTTRDAYLAQLKSIVNYVWTMAYWLDFEEQRTLLLSYQNLLDSACVGMGVGLPGMTSPGQNTPLDIVPQMAAYTPQAGMMIWALNAKCLPEWYQLMVDNMPIHLQKATVGTS